MRQPERTRDPQSGKDRASAASGNLEPGDGIRARLAHRSLARGSRDGRNLDSLVSEDQPCYQLEIVQ